MKLQILLVLTILPMLVIPAFADVTMSDIKIINLYNGKDVDIINKDQQVQISANLTNNSINEQSFAYVILTNNENSLNLSWMTGSLSPNQTYNAVLSILPEKAGLYENTIFVFDSINLEYRHLLTSIHTLNFITGIDSTVTSKNDFIFNLTLEESPFNTFTTNINSEHYKGKDIIITGNIPELPLIGLPTVTLFIKNENLQIHYIDAVPIKSDWTYEFIIDSSTLEEGNYTLEINSDTKINSFDISILNPITLQSDEYYHYVDDNIKINGEINNIDYTKDTTINYNIINPFGIEIGSGQSNSLQNDGTFQFTITAEEKALWVEHSEDVIFIINIQGYEQSTIFYSSSFANKTPEANYDKLMNHNNTLAIHNDMLFSHNSTMNDQDYMIGMHDNMFTNQTEIITFQQEQIISLQTKTTDQQEQIIQLESQIAESLTQLKLVGGYLVSANVTLGEEFPAVLNAKDNKKIETEIQRLNDSIIRSETKITDTRASLDEALLAGNPNKINKFTNSMGSQLLSSEILKSQLKMIYFYLDVYPQES